MAQVLKSMRVANSDLQQINQMNYKEMALGRPEAKGKFFYVGQEKLYVRGVTYGTFKPDKYGNEFHDPEVVEKDFAQMGANGINLVRIYTAPPKWLLDIALRYRLYVMVICSPT